ncbi:MAG TPA: lanthionine synthetase LanC family protein [Bacteroidia bacterium]|nr:lanthionine synthetase LanC family protein [Bacteroidia bacterium]
MLTEIKDSTATKAFENLSKIFHNWTTQNITESSIALHGDGLASDIMFLTGIFGVIKDDRIEELMQSKIVQGISAIQKYNPQTEYIMSTFCSGYTGFALAVKHLVKSGVIEWDDNLQNFFKDLDETIYLSAMDHLSNKQNFDFLHGGIGNAIYLIDNIEEGANQEYIKEIFDKVFKSVIKLNKGITWPYIDLSKKGGVKSIIYNSSVSHGLSSMIYFLTQMVKKDFPDKNVKGLLNQCLETVFYYSKDNFIPEKNKNFFIDTGRDYEFDFGKRVAWCYGDLGMCSVLYQAAEVLNSVNELKEKIISICLETTKRKDFEDTFIEDATFCHGASGVAYIYFKFYKITGRNEFKEAADYWLKYILSMAHHEDDADGYKTWDMVEQKWEKKFGILDGTAGIGLTLSAFIKDEPGVWDKVFLLS